MVALRWLALCVWSLVGDRDKFGCVCDGCFAEKSNILSPIHDDLAKPLSGFLITMSLHRFSSLTAFTNDLDGHGPFLSM